MGHDKILTDHHPQSILRHIWETSKNAEFFFWKITPLHRKNRFWKSKGSPLWMLKKNLQIKFLSKPCDGIWSHDSKMVLHLGIENIFCKYFFQKIGKNILKNIFDQIFTKDICNTQVLHHFGIVRPKAMQWLW